MFYMYAPCLPWEMIVGRSISSESTHHDNRNMQEAISIAAEFRQFLESYTKGNNRTVEDWYC